VSKFPGRGGRETFSPERGFGSDPNGLGGCGPGRGAPPRFQGVGESVIRDQLRLYSSSSSFVLPDEVGWVELNSLEAEGES
jgi:hypothetical protein